MRKTAEVYIYVDLAAALRDGLLFFVSENKVLLSPGDAKGAIAPQYAPHFSCTPPAPDTCTHSSTFLLLDTSRM